MTPHTRRAVLAGGTSLLASPFLAPGTDAGSVPWLKELGAEKGIEIGSCMSGEGDALDRALLRQHAAVITPEWCLKPRFLKTNETAPYRFEKADEIYAFCRSAHAKMHGHTLFWHANRFTFADTPDRVLAEQTYGRFLAAVVSRYPAVPSWDVANEILADPGPALLRDEYLASTHGLPFIAFLYKRTHELAPRARLVLNDYNLECGGSWCADKAKRLLSLVDELKDLGAPLHAIGIQSHISSRHGIAIDATLDLCERLAARGLDVYLSEMDVNDIVFEDDIALRDAAVADMYAAYLRPLLAHRAVKRLMFWGLSDRDHWMVREQDPDGRPKGLGRPALFDHDARPKPAFKAVVDALRKAPARKA